MKKYIFYILVILLFSVWLYGLYLYTGQMEFGLIILALFCTVITFFIVAAIKAIIWRVQNGVDLLATLETDPEKVKGYMLLKMQYGHYEGIKGVLREFNDIFRNYPQWEFQKWEVFRAWYKNLIDHAIKNPEIYKLTMKDGSLYDIEKDPLYDPDAPDWEQFDRKRYYDDDDDEDDDDDFSDNSSNDKDSLSDCFCGGIGMGLASSIFSGSGNSRSGSD